MKIRHLTRVLTFAIYLQAIGSEAWAQAMRPGADAIRISDEFAALGKTRPESFAVTQADIPEITNPAPGAQLQTNLVTLSWSAGRGAVQYWLDVGSEPFGYEIYSHSQGLNRSVTVNVPSDGRYIYATLWSFFPEINDWAWAWARYRTSHSGREPATMIAPGHGAMLSRNQTFTWTAGSGVLEYWLDIGSSPFGWDIFSLSTGSNRSATASIPGGSGIVYVTLWSWTGHDWLWQAYEYRRPSASNGTLVLNIVNELAYPITVAVNGRSWTIPAFDQGAAEVQGPNLTVRWDLQQPMVNGRTVGDPMGGSFNITNASGRYDLTIDNIVGDQHFFVPFISNQTSADLLIMVNGGLQSENRCNCTVPAYRENVAPGYYRLHSNSNLRLYRAGSNYTGPYIFWGSDRTVNPSGSFVNSVERSSGIFRVNATWIP